MFLGVQERKEGKEEAGVDRYLLLLYLSKI